MPKIVRCDNHVEGCWREFELTEPHEHVGDKRFCSADCAEEYTRYSKRFETLAHSFYVPTVSKWWQH